VVGVAHRQCRQHEWMDKFQWRLSFSRAEIVLINSWMPVQQIVYHMLRHFIKSERLINCADNSGTGTLSNYHIKTLMLWACELKPESWWTENLNLVRICVELLQTLSVWLTDTRCPHYFINNCNLLDNSFKVGSAASKLMSADEEYLSTWFVNNYIRQCARLCPTYISRLFNDVSASTKPLQNIVSEVTRWRLNTFVFDFWQVFDFAEITIAAEMFLLKPLTVRSNVCVMNELKKIDQRLYVYFSAVALLHFAHNISRNGLNDNMLDILAIIADNNVDTSYGSSSLNKTELSTSELVEFLQKTAVERLITYRHLVARDFLSVVTIVTTDFEAMYAYKRGDYQRCLQLSTQNVRTLLYATRFAIPPVSPVFMPLLDDDIVSLSALTVIVNPDCRDHFDGIVVTQLTLSLYLMTQCQLKLHHSVTLLAQTLHYLKIAQRRHPREYTLDHLTFKLTERKIHRTISH